MRIGITTFGGDGGKSGISRYIISLLQALVELPGDDTFEVLVYRDEHAIFVPDHPRIRGLRLPGLLRKPLPDIAWHQLALPPLALARRYDVLFLPAANRRVALSTPCPRVGTVHDVAAVHVPEKYDAARSFYVRRVLPLPVRRLDHVLTVSESSKRDIVTHLGVPPERVTVTPLAADPRHYVPVPPAEAAARVRARHGVAAPYILYVARIEHPGKNHVALIRAFAELVGRHGLPYDLVLAGSDWLRAAEVHRAAAETGLAGRIRFLGFVPEAALPDLYAGADLFVFPSLYEGFGLPILEAMACGAPVVYANVSSLPEVAGAAGVPFDPADPAALPAAMTAVLLDPERAALLRRLGPPHSRTFTWQRTAQATLAVLHAVARKSGR